MTSKTQFIVAATVMFALFFVVLAWIGRVSYGSRTFLDRRTNPAAFWTIYAIFFAMGASNLWYLPAMIDHMVATKAKQQQSSKLPGDT